MYAYTGILAALLQRQKTGLGSHLGVAMLEALAEWISYPLYYAFDGSSPPERGGAVHATIYPYGPFQAGDGHSDAGPAKRARVAGVLPRRAAPGRAGSEPLVRQQCQAPCEPQRAARGRWKQIDSPVGPLPALLPPGVSDVFDYRMDAIPEVGEHTEAILRELGFADADIASFHSKA